MKEEFDIEEDVNALLAGEDLSEEFQEKARTIFEAAIRSKVSEIKEELQETYENALIEEVQFIKEELTERVDTYLEYVADEWIQENALAVEHGLKTEMTESFLQGMKSLFEDHYVTIPEDRYDVIESMVDKLDEMEEKLNEQIQRNVALNRRLAESVADVIFADVAEGLALSQKDKLASLAENVEFDSEANYREKLVTLRESYFPTNTSTQRDVTENLSEEVSYEGSEHSSVSPIMEAYLQTLSRVANK
jgi:SHS2 domain-containing protein